MGGVKGKEAALVPFVLPDPGGFPLDTIRWVAGYSPALGCDVRRSSTTF
jgi:hypothetical protein